jgi:hypothetical protein
VSRLANFDLDLAALRQPMPALTEHGGGAMAEAASVCFAIKGHPSLVPMTVFLKLERESQLTCRVLCLTITDAMLRAYDDLQDATEDGAYGVAILLLKTIEGFSVVRRARKRSGFDYWLGYAHDPALQNKARLEVSGIIEGDESEIRARVAQKLRQTDRSDDTGLPASVVVVSYVKPESWVVKK